MEGMSVPLCTGVSRVWLPLDSVCRHRAGKAWDERRDVRLTLENSNLQALAEEKKKCLENFKRGQSWWGTSRGGCV